MIKQTSSGLKQSQEAEMWGLKMAIFRLRDLGFSNVIIELDCKLVVDGIRGTKLNLSTEFNAMLFVCIASLIHYLTLG
jgi:ribonuclease HI